MHHLQSDINWYEFFSMDIISLFWCCYLIHYLIILVHVIRDNGLGPILQAVNQFVNQILQEHKPLWHEKSCRVHKWAAQLLWHMHICDVLKLLKSTVQLKGFLHDFHQKFISHLWYGSQLNLKLCLTLCDRWKWKKNMPKKVQTGHTSIWIVQWDRYKFHVILQRTTRSTVYISSVISTF